MSGWQALDDEVARWRDAGRDVELWWRDDDAADTGAALDRLLELQRQTAVPLALAVVPARATQALAERLAGAPAIDVLQHGYAHANHALPPDKKSELGPHRPAMLVLGELGTGRMALERLFASRALPVLVPPWNRIDEGLVGRLAFGPCVRLSTYGPHPGPAPAAAGRINTHGLGSGTGLHRSQCRHRSGDRLSGGAARGKR